MASSPVAAPVPLPIPAPASVDAKSRAWRTLVQGATVSVAAAVVPVALAASGTIHWTGAWWAALGVTCGQTALTAGLSYVARHVVPPATS